MGITITIENERPVGYLTSAEFAEKCGVNDATIRSWAKRGKLNTALKIGSDLWIPEDEGYPVRINKKRNANGEVTKDFEFFYFVEDVATILEVDRETVRRWIRSGKLKAKAESKRGGYRIEHEELAKFAQSYSAKSRDLWRSKGLA